MRRLLCDVIENTPVGVVAVVSRGRRVLSVFIGLESKLAAARDFRRLFPGAKVAPRRTPAGAQLRQYFAGKRRTFRVKCALDGLPPFHRKALAACRKIPFGKVVSYKELARAAGSPGAVRAVGQALKCNPLPIIVPCHRVVAARAIGGFSAPGGLRTKRSLLRLEGALPLAR